MDIGNEQENYINKAHLRGRIVNIYRNDATLFVSISDGNYPHVNYPRALFFGENADRVGAEFAMNDFIDIKGFIQSRKRTDGNGRPVYAQAVFGVSADRPASILESEGISGGSKTEPPVNDFVVKGEVTSVETPSPGVVSLIIKSAGRSGKLSFIRMFYYGNDIGEFMNTYRAGDTVAVTGDFQTSKKTGRDGRLRHYENVIIREIVKPGQKTS